MNAGEQGQADIERYDREQARRARRKSLLTRAEGLHARAVHFIEKSEPNMATACALTALLSMALSHERTDDD